jgi:hypothetical protein
VPLQNAVRIDFRAGRDRIDIGALVVLLGAQLADEGLIESEIAGHRDHVDDMGALALRGIAIEVVTEDRVAGLVPIGLEAGPAGTAAGIDVDVGVSLDEKIRQVDGPSLWQLVIAIRMMTRVVFFEIVKV